MKKYKFNLSIFTIALLVVSGVQAGEVTSTFGTGDTLTATQMTEIKDAVNDNDTRIDALQVSGGETLAGLSCASGQVAKFDGTSWACATDDISVDIYTGGTGIDVTGTTVSISTGGVTATELASDAINSSKIEDGSIVAADIDNTSVQQRLNMGCAAGSSIRDIAADGTPTCELDYDTTYSAGSGLNLTGTSFSLDSILSVSEINYTTAKTHYISIPAEAFDSALGNPVNTSFGNGGAFPTSGVNDAMVAPVYLPNGAVITGFDFYYVKNSTSNLSPTLYFRNNTGTTGFNIISGLSTSGGSVSTAVQTVSGTVSSTVDNSSRNYFVRVFGNAWPGDGSLKINAARITYTISIVE